MTLTTADIPYDVDGTTMIGRLALPTGDDARPGILIAHEGNGLDDWQKLRPERFAELGYVAFGLDYHGGGTPMAERAEINDRLTELSADPDRVVRIAGAGLDVLLAQPRTDVTKVAAIGYCFGGTMVLELARSGADLRAVIGMHPGLTTTRPGSSANIVGSVLVCVGADDPIVPVEQRLAFEDEMRAAGVDWRINLYGGAAHSFTNPQAGRFGSAALAHHQPTDERSWRAVLDLLDEAFA